MDWNGTLIYRVSHPPPFFSYPCTSCMCLQPGIQTTIIRNSLQYELTFTLEEMEEVHSWKKWKKYMGGRSETSTHVKEVGNMHTLKK